MVNQHKNQFLIILYVIVIFCVFNIKIFAEKDFTLNIEESINALNSHNSNGKFLKHLFYNFYKKMEN